MTQIQDHFSAIAPVYQSVRDTDQAPISTIQEFLPLLTIKKCIELGCGTGRYSEALLTAFEENGMLYCVDSNQEMLAALDANLASSYPDHYSIVHSDAEQLELASDEFEAVFSFNALHHFDMELTLHKIARWLRLQGRAFLYTRTPAQNARHIWGQHFPNFIEKERRLKSKDTLTHLVATTKGLTCVAVKKFTYQRQANLQDLLDKVRHYHYSTFRFYDPDGLDEACHTFTQRLKVIYPDLNHITWTDSNLMIVVERTSS
jgi:ubiquinone/menaquinone biosynthesis C-methylase UbiE